MLNNIARFLFSEKVVKLSVAWCLLRLCRLRLSAALLGRQCVADFSTTACHTNTDEGGGSEDSLSKPF
jgi:hypothetical protein